MKHSTTSKTQSPPSGKSWLRDAQDLHSSWLIGNYLLHVPCCDQNAEISIDAGVNLRRRLRVAKKKKHTHTPWQKGRSQANLVPSPHNKSLELYTLHLLQTKLLSQTPMHGRGVAVGEAFLHDGYVTCTC